MATEFLNTLFLGTAFLILFGCAELLYHKLKMKVELTRKLVHAVTGFLTLLFPLVLRNHWMVLLLCVLFFLILLLSLKFNFLKSINAIERRSFGSLLYPISVYLCYLYYEKNNNHYHYFYMPILILAISDPLAALFGKRWPLGRYNLGKANKTLFGSTVFFISALLVCIVLLYVENGANTSLSGVLVLASSVSIIATVAEATSNNGFDNFSIPISTIIALTILEPLLPY